MLLQHVHCFVHVRADFDAVELRDFVEHDLDVVLDLRRGAFFHASLDRGHVAVRDADGGEDVLELDRQLVLGLLHLFAGRHSKTIGVFVFFALEYI